MRQNPCALQCALGVHRVALDGGSRSSLLLLAALCSSLCDFAELPPDCLRVYTQSSPSRYIALLPG